MDFLLALLPLDMQLRVFLFQLPEFRQYGRRIQPFRQQDPVCHNRL